MRANCTLNLQDALVARICSKPLRHRCLKQSARRRHAAERDGCSQSTHTHTPMCLLRAVTPQPCSTAQTLGISSLTRFRFPPWKNRHMIRAQPERQKPHLKAQRRFRAVLLHCTFIFFSDLPPQPPGEGTNQLLQEPGGSPAVWHRGCRERSGAELGGKGSPGSPCTPSSRLPPCWFCLLPSLTLATGQGSASPPRLPKSLFQPCPSLQMDELRATLNHTFSLELAPGPPSIASPGLASTAIGFIIMPCCPNSLRTQFSTDLVTLCRAGSLRAGSPRSRAHAST